MTLADSMKLLLLKHTNDDRQMTTIITIEKESNTKAATTTTNSKLQQNQPNNGICSSRNNKRSCKINKNSRNIYCPLRFIQQSLLICILCFVLQHAQRQYEVQAADGLQGDLQSCSNEGEEWHVDRISKCHKCTCKNGFVKCDNGNCPPIDDCYLLDHKKLDDCCGHRCKGCVYHGISYASGSEWTDDSDPCHVYKCIASVVTETTMLCHTQCNTTLIAPPQPHECCASCQGCKFNGQTIAEGQEVVSTHDRCLVCRCTSNRLTCSKRSCPVLQCPQQEYVPNECCPRCKTKRDPLLPVQGRCMFNRVLYFDTAQFTPDRCTNCTCVNGTSVCQRNTCPIVECQVNNNTNDCCPPCLSADVRSECIYNGTSYHNDETWHLGPCRSCRCSNGNIRCSEMRCPAIRCRSNEELKVPDGECCPRCIEAPGTCTVFGDPHFKTFDSKFYSFQGSCKYLLAADCVNHTFSIRLTNDARETKRSSWTKTVTLKLHGVRINFGQKLRVKVNGSLVTVPYRHDTILNIERLSAGVLLTTNIGLSVEWDGNNFLQLVVPASYKRRLCGLCGNYNGIARDDLTARNGYNYTDQDVWRFANSWRVGGSKACTRRHENIAVQATCNKRKPNIYCNPLFLSDVFGNCDNHLNPINYIESCRMDVCECPTNLCHCDSFAAYAHECKKLGVILPDWRAVTNCPVGLWQRNATALTTLIQSNTVYSSNNNYNNRHNKVLPNHRKLQRQHKNQQQHRRKSHKTQQHYLQPQQQQEHKFMQNQLQSSNVIIKDVPKHARHQISPPPLH